MSIEPEFSDEFVDEVIRHGGVLGIIYPEDEEGMHSFDDSVCMCGPSVEIEDGGLSVIHESLSDSYSGKWKLQPYSWRHHVS